MRQMRLVYPVPLMCRIAGVSASGYYSRLNRPPSQRSRKEGRLETEIRAAYKRTRETYGHERLQRDLAEHVIQAGVCQIRRIRKKPGLCCKQRRKFKAATDSKHTLPAAKNLLSRQFAATAPNQIWVTDITCIPAEGGWLYCAGHKDIFTGEVAGYAMGPGITKNLVSQSLFPAVETKRPESGLIHHSDRGSRYCAH